MKKVLVICAAVLCCLNAAFSLPHGGESCKCLNKSVKIISAIKSRGFYKESHARLLLETKKKVKAKGNYEKQK